MNRQYLCIPIDNGYVVYEEGEIKHTNNYAICLSEVEEHPEDAIIRPQVGCNSVGECVACRKIITHTGIPSLKDSGLPIVEIPPYQKGSGYHPEHTYHQIWMDGYKAAGGYTEEDMLNAIYYFMTVERYGDTSKIDLKVEIQNYLNTLKKHPKAVVLEMVEVFKTGLNVPVNSISGGTTRYYEPKVVDGKVIAKEVIYDGYE